MFASKMYQHARKRVRSGRAVTQPEHETFGSLSTALIDRCPASHVADIHAQTGATLLNLLVSLRDLTSTMQISKVSKSGFRDSLMRSLSESGDQTGFRFGTTSELKLVRIWENLPSGRIRLAWYRRWLWPM